MTYRIRRARPDDLGEVVQVRMRAWQESFRGFLPAETLDALPESPWAGRLLAEWRDHLADGGDLWLGVDEQGSVVGFAEACRDAEEEAPTHRMLSKLYLLDEAKGSGLAEALMDRAIGSHEAYLWVLEDNERARRFYRHHGFECDGGVEHLEDDLAHVRTVRMVRRVEPSVPVG